MDSLFYNHNDTLLNYSNSMIVSIIKLLQFSSVSFWFPRWVPSSFSKCKLALKSLMKTKTYDQSFSILAIWIISSMSYSLLRLPKIPFSCTEKSC